MTNQKPIIWEKEKELVEAIRLLTPYMTYADIGRLLGRNRRTIHTAAKRHNLVSSKKKIPPVIIIKDRDKFDEDMLSLKELQ